MENIPCKYGYPESQNHPYGMGSAREYWFECGHPDLEGPDFDDSDAEAWEHCGETCPGYEPLKILVCEKHGEYFEGDTCGGCDVEEWERDNDLAEQFWKEMEERYREERVNGERECGEAEG